MQGAELDSGAGVLLMPSGSAEGKSHLVFCPLPQLPGLSTSPETVFLRMVGTTDPARRSLLIGLDVHARGTWRLAEGHRRGHPCLRCPKVMVGTHRIPPG